jgi:hypothetical protein
MTDYPWFQTVCDLEHGKLQNVLICPWHDLWSFVEAGGDRGENWGRDAREALRRGNLPGYHLVNEAQQDGLSLTIGVVDFHEVYSTPTELVRQHAVRIAKRLRLNPPYREHLRRHLPDFSCESVCRWTFPASD